MFTKVLNDCTNEDMQRREFYLTRRKLKSGRYIYYYYFYNAYGERSVPRTTKCSKKADAFAYCVNLLRCGGIDSSKMKFKHYALGFFDTSNRWYQDKILTGKFSDQTLRVYNTSLNCHILPFFGDMYVHKITSNIIRSFRVYLAEEKGLAPKSINNTVNVLRIIFDWALEDNLIIRNPINKNIRPLDVEKNREAFTMKEVEYLFENKWDNEECYFYSLTAAITGLRFSEVAGLKPENIYEDYIDVKTQFLEKECDVKHHEARFVTIPKILAQKLKQICENRKFIFNSPVLSDAPISRKTVIKHFYKHYSAQMQNDKTTRVLTFHSLRYFFNTFLVSQNIQSQKIDFLIGHSPGRGSMQQLYTSWKPEMYGDVLQLQTELLTKIVPAASSW